MKTRQREGSALTPYRIGRSIGVSNHIPVRILTDTPSQGYLLYELASSNETHQHNHSVVI